MGLNESPMLTRSAELCDRLVDEGGCPSVSIAVADKGEITFADAWGWADVEAEVPATPQTAYLLASATKPLTATAVCLLAELGRFDLDDAITSHLPDLRFTARRGGPPPTIRQLLAHTSGLGLHFDFTYADDDRATPGIHEMVEAYGNLFHSAGTRFNYTNLGYGILDELIRHTTDGSASAFVESQVCAPLGLDSISVGPVYDGTAAVAKRYTRGGVAYPAYDTSHRGASLGWSTAADLALFGQTLAGGRSALTPESRAAMRTPVVRDGATGYGLGWAIDDLGGHATIGHTGAMGGVDTSLVVVPDLGLSVAVLVNQMWSVTGEVMRDVLAQLVPGQHASSDTDGAGHGSPVPPGTWAGAVATAEGEVRLTLQVTADGDVVACLGDGSAVRGVVESSFHVHPATDLGVSLPVQLPTADARIRSPQTYLALELDGPRLVGSTRAMPLGDDSGGWFGNCYSHWCELLAE